MIFFGDLAYSNERINLEIDLGSFSHCNLESPILPGDYSVRKARKVGPHLRQPPEFFRRTDLKHLSFSLANNHTMDYGFQGLASTLEFLEPRFSGGAGPTRVLARKPITHKLGQTEISIISCSDQFFGEAGIDTPGIASVQPFDNWVSKLIESETTTGRIPIISFHGGYERFMLPSPAMRRLFRGWIDIGAEAVIAHHSHIPMPWEEYGGKRIYYGLGNFLVEPRRWARFHPLSLTSIVVNVSPSKKGLEVSHDYIRLSLDEDGAGVVAYETEENSNRLLDHSERIGQLLLDESKYLAVLASYGRQFFDRKVRRRLAQGILGMSISKTIGLRGAELDRGEIASKMRQGFGPHFFDIFSQASTRELFEIATHNVAGETKFSNSELAWWNLES